jgi:gliding motility-associated-like protein
LGLDTSICEGETVFLDAGNPGLNHVWNTGATSQTIDVVNVPITVTVMVDRDGCYASDSVRINSACDIFVPNAFSPNDDGLNDVFTYISKHVSGAEIWVYDRWGKRVFYSETEKERWDGTDGWDTNYPAGLYVYIIRGTYRSGKPFDLNGTVLLLR